MIVRTEADVAAACDALAQASGWRIDRLEQRRASRIVEGLPDRRYHRLGQRVWVELKAPGGKLTTAQHAWLLSELEAGALATAIDHPAQFTRLLQLLARRSASLDASARDLCRVWVDLIWQRGRREGGALRAGRPSRHESVSDKGDTHVAAAAPRSIATHERQTVEGLDA